MSSRATGLWKCNVIYEGRLLSALDGMGVARHELSLPRDGFLTFRVPETVNVGNESMVEVKDGVTTILTDQFGSFAAMPVKEPYPTVTVAGKFSPVDKKDTYPASVEFTNTATGQVFLSVATNGE